jgi:hypothetical protein
LLPGVALGSETLLIVERAAAFFAALLFLVVVLVRAWEGALPEEVSGRGVKYASREAAEEARDAAADALEELRVAQGELAERLDALERG